MGARAKTELGESEVLLTVIFAPMDALRMAFDAAIALQQNRGAYLAPFGKNPKRSHGAIIKSRAK